MCYHMRCFVIDNPKSHINFNNRIFLRIGMIQFITKVFVSLKDFQCCYEYLISTQATNKHMNKPNFSFIPAFYMLTITS